MAVSSGLGGTVNGFDTVRKWSVNNTDAGPSFVASNSDGMTGSIAGNKDWSGTVELYGYTPAFIPGEGLTFAGWNGASRATGTAIVNSLSLTCDIEAGGILSHTLGIQGNGALSFNTTTVTDSANPAIYTAIGCKAAFDAAGGSSYTDIDNVKNWSLNIDCATQQYVNSGTAGIVLRKAGVLSGKASVAVDQDAYASLPTVGTVGSLRLYVSATLHYQLLYCRVVDVTRTTDIETGAINGAVINYDYTGFKSLTGVMTKGSITKPDTTVLWN